MSRMATQPEAGAEPGAGPDTEARPTAPADPVGWHQLPVVNLLPAEIIEGRRFARARKVLAGVLVTTVLVGAGGVVAEQRSVSSAQAELDEATSDVASLQQQQLKYRAVPALSAQIAAATAARTAALSQDVLWYRLLVDMDGARPAGLTTGNATITLTSTSGSGSTPGSGSAPAAGQPDPLTKAGIGSVTFTGSAAAYSGVAGFIEALDAVSGLGSTALSNAATDQDGKVTYTVSSVVTDGALSHRYTTKGD